MSFVPVLAAMPMPSLPPLHPLVAFLDGARSAAADASLFLLVGGLVMLMLVCFLVFIQNLLPEKADDGPKAGAGKRRLRSLDGGPLAQDLARRNGRERRGVAIAPVDLALDRLVELHVGEPRLLLAHERASRERLYGCRGCSYGTGAGGAASGAAGGCARERAALEQVFRAVYGPAVRTQESACRRRGDASCEFEVAH